MTNETTEIKPIDSQEQPEQLEQTTQTTTLAPLEDYLFPELKQEPPPKITDEDKEAFFKAFLNDTPFRQTQYLFDGKYKVVFQALTIPEAAAIQRQIRMDLDRGQVADNAYVIEARMYRLAVALREINGEPFLPILDVNTSDDVEKGITFVKLRMQPIEGWTEYKIAALIDAHIRFERKVFELSKKVQEPDFWKAAA